MIDFYYKISDDLIIVDNLDHEAFPRRVQKRYMTENTDIYVVHVIEGWMDLVVNGNMLRAEKGDFMILLKGSFIETLNTSPDMKFFCVLYNRSTEGGLFGEIGLDLGFWERINKYYHYRHKETDQMEYLGLYQAVRKHLVLQTITANAIARRLLEALLLHDLDLYCLEHPETLAPPSRKQMTFRNFMALLEKYSLTERSLSFYAEQLQLTPKYLSATIKEVSGMHFKYWLDEPMIVEAKKLLHNPDLRIQDISSKLGFQAHNKFARFFRNATGMSPTEYRDSIMQ